MNGERCTATKVDGTPCNGISISTDSKCWAHSEQLTEIRNAAKNLGGRKPTEIMGIPFAIANMQNVMDLISEQVANLRRLPNSIQQAKALLQAADTAMRALELFEFEKKLDELEGGDNESKKY
jgi:hypothetical protein